MHPDVVVMGAGIIGAACAQALTARGLHVLVLDRHGPASGTSAAGEGNVLVSDKEPGPELDLAKASRELWPDLAGDAEWEEKGGLVVATTPEAAEPLKAFAAKQRAAGVDACEITTAEALTHEPHLNPEITAPSTTCRTRSSTRSRPPRPCCAASRSRAPTCPQRTVAASPPPTA